MDNRISVEDSLPEPYESVLFCGRYTGSYFIGYWDSISNMWQSSNDYHYPNSVKFWQRLPEPPSNELTKKMVKISKEEYEQLIEDRRFLSCLEEAGVDNWRGYGDALELFEE